jgi:integrase
MPQLKYANPRYRRHRASGQAVVTLNGIDHYLGPYGTAASRREYDRLLAIWLANDRRPAVDTAPGLTIVEVLAAFRRHAEKHYRKNGQPTRSLGNIDDALRPLRQLFGREPVSGFGPLKLQAIQQTLATSGLARPTVNKRIGIIKKVFRWAVAQELAPPSLSHALDSVDGLQRGRSEAREPEPVKPVDDATIDATLPHLPEVVRDMVKLQRLTGCRPGEVCALRPCDVDRAGDVWQFRPTSHKTEHHGRERVIYIGPQAQAVLLPYLLRDPSTHCFSPADSERKRHAQQRAARRTRVQPSQLARVPKRNPKRTASTAFDKNAYARCIVRACHKAGVPRWSPNRLRHTAATEIRSRFGLEAAQVILGHSRADTTQIYAARDEERGLEVVKAIG